MTTGSANALNISQQGTVYFDGVYTFDGLDGGTAGNVLTSNGTGTAPSFQAPAASGIATIDGDSGAITGATVTIFANQATLNSGSSVEFVNSGTVSTLNVTDSSGNTIIGQGAGVLSNTASQCTALGGLALAAITDDDTQVAIGYGALQAANDGTGNVAVGSYALNALGSSGDNTAIGTHAGISLTSGNFNTMLGYLSGTNYTGSESNNLLLYNAGVLGENNTIRIGTQGTDPTEQNSCFIAGITGATPVDANSPQVTLCDNQGNLTVVPDPTAGYVLTSNSPNSPTFQPVVYTPPAYFSAYVDPAYTNCTGDGTIYPIIYQNTTKNVGSGYNNATGIFTTPTTGFYHFSVNLLSGAYVPANTDFQLRVVIVATALMGSLVLNPYVIYDVVSSSIATSLNFCWALTAGDQVQVQLTVSGNGAPNVTLYADTTSTFSGFYIGP